MTRAVFLSYTHIELRRDCITDISGLSESSIDNIMTIDDVVVEMLYKREISFMSQYLIYDDVLAWLE